MISKQEMWRIACALLRAIRQSIPFSDNIDNVYRVFEESNDEKAIYQIDSRGLFRSNQVRRIKKIRNLNLPPDNPAYLFQILKYGTAPCEELSYALALLLKCIPSANEKIYLSVLSTRDHVFCVLHQNETIYQTSRERKVFELTDSLQNLIRHFSTENTILIDAWINTAALLPAYQKFLEKAKQYDVSEYFEGKISCEITCCLGEENDKPLPFEMKKILSEYQLFYLRMRNHNIHLAYSRKYPSVLKEVDKFSVLWREKAKPLKDLQAFLQKLINARSLYDSLKKTEPLKYRYFAEIIQFIELCTNRKDYKSLVNLKEIVLAFFRITLLIRDQKAPSTIRASSLTMTHTGQALLEYLKTSNLFLFENLVDLTFLKDAVSESLTTRHAYFALCQALHQENIDHFIAISAPKKMLPPASNLWAFNPRLHHHNMAWLARDHNARLTCSSPLQLSAPDRLAYLYDCEYAQLCYQRLHNLLNWANPNNRDWEEILTD